MVNNKSEPKRITLFKENNNFRKSKNKNISCSKCYKAFLESSKCWDMFLIDNNYKIHNLEDHVCDQFKKEINENRYDVDKEFLDK